MQDATAIERIRRKYRALSPVMDERVRRQWAAAEAAALGWGGIATVSAATGLARNTIAAGLRELEHRRGHPDEPVAIRLRRVGAGRKPLTEIDPGLLQALDALVDPVTRGHPESPLRWTCKSTRELAEELQRQKHPVTDRTVAALLKQLGYSLQSDRKTKEGTRTRTATPSSSTSAARSSPASAGVSPSCRSTPRRRSWSASSRTWARSGNRRASPNRSTPTISR